MTAVVLVLGTVSSEVREVKCAGRRGKEQRVMGILVWKDETVRGWKKWRRADRSEQRRGSSLKRAFFSCPGTRTWCLGWQIADFCTWAVSRCVGSPHAKHLPAGYHPAGCHGTVVLCFLNSDRSCTVDLKVPAQFRSFLGCQDTVTMMEA